MIFDSLGFWELGVIAVLVVLLVEPKQLTKIVKAFGRFKRKVTQLQADVKREIDAVAALEEAQETHDKRHADKAAMRRWAKERIQGMTASDRDEAAEAIARTLFDWPGYKNAKTVSCFVGTLEELDTLPILRRILADGKILLIPYVRTDNRPASGGESSEGKGPETPGKSLGMAAISDVDRDLTEGAFRILEPRQELREREGLPDPDLVLIPGLCFDTRGGRVGKGLGFYDKYLATAPAAGAAKIGLGFDVQITEKKLLLEPHDKLLDAVLSEKRFLLLSPSRPQWQGGQLQPAGEAGEASGRQSPGPA